MQKIISLYLHLFVYVGFLLVSGCACLEKSLPQHHRAFIGQYPEQLPLLLETQKTVLVGGVFDVIHYGHLSFFKAAKAQGDILIVALESDEFVKKYKHRTPVHSQLQRAEILSHLDMIDEVIMLPQMKGYKDYLTLVQKVKPSVIAITEGDPYQTEKEKQALTIGAQVVPIVTRNTSLSTSQILRYSCQ